MWMVLVVTWGARGAMVGLLSGGRLRPRVVRFAYDGRRCAPGLGLCCYLGLLNKLRGGWFFKAGEGF